MLPLLFLSTSLPVSQRLLDPNACTTMILLPGKVAKAVRSRAVDILVQYFDNNTEKFMSWTVESAKQVQEEEAEREPETKYIYGAESEAFLGLVKIGFTSSLDTRMESTNTFCARAPFRIAAHGRAPR